MLCRAKRLMAAESGRSVLWAMNPGRPDMEASETMLRAVMMFVGRAV